MRNVKIHETDLSRPSVSDASELSIQLAALNTQLQRRNKELSVFMETSSIGLHWVGSDGVIQWANAADYEMLGYAADEYIGRSIKEFHLDTDVIEDILAR